MKLKSHLKIFQEMNQNIEGLFQKNEKDNRNEFLKELSGQLIQSFNYLLKEIKIKEKISCTTDDFKIFFDLSKEIKKLKKMRKRFVLLAGKDSAYSRQLKKKNFSVIY